MADLTAQAAQFWDGLQALAEASPNVFIKISMLCYTDKDWDANATVVDAVHRLRDMDLAKPPGVAETLDWVESLGAIGADDLDAETAADTLGSVIKDRDDLDIVSGDIGRVVPDR